MENRRRGFLGGLLIVVGVLLLLDSMGEIDFREALRTYWPLLLVIWGIWILFQHRAAPSHRHETLRAADAGVFGDKREDVKESEISYSNVFGDVAVRVTSSQFKGGSVSTVFGDTTVDMGDCSLAEGEHVVRISGVFGDSHVIVPHDAEVAVDANAVFGSVDTRERRRDGFSPAVSYETPGYSSAPRKIRIRASQVFGDVHVH